MELKEVQLLLVLGAFPVIIVALMAWACGDSILPRRISLIKVEKFGKHDKKITVRCGKEEIAYVGGCTVWHQYPSGKRAGTSMESILSDWDQADEWKRKHQTNA